jgi:hypothetical protein
VRSVRVVDHTPFTHRHRVTKSVLDDDYSDDGEAKTKKRKSAVNGKKGLGEQLVEERSDDNGTDSAVA